MTQDRDEDGAEGDTHEVNTTAAEHRVARGAAGPS